MDDHSPSEELLEATHQFPGVYQIKAIGATDNDFVTRVLEAAASELASLSEVEHSVRQTRNGRHVAVTLDLTVQSAGQVRAIYARLQEVSGLALLF